MTEWHPLRSLEGNDGNESELSRMWKELDNSAEKVGRMIANTSPAKMPTLDHSSMADYYDVYEPSDDTYLLIDAIKYDLFSEYPSDTRSDDGAKAVETNDSNGGENEEEIIHRAALESFYHGVQLRSDRNGKEVERAHDEDLQIVQDLVEKEGYGADRSAKILSRLQQVKRLEQIQTVMEIGTGSGVPITYLSKRLLVEKPKTSRKDENDNNNTTNKGFSVIATDLNPLALEFAKKTAQENGVIIAQKSSEIGETQNSKHNNNAGIQSIEFIECDLATPLLEDREGTIDVLVFNPPYVPTEDSEVSGNGIEISWAGGKDGRRIIDRALPQIARLLQKPDGVCYMITVDDNLPSELATFLRKEYGLKMMPLVRRRARNEYLSVQKISWLQPP